MNQEKLGSFSENKGRAGKKQVLWAWLRTILLVLPHFFLSWAWFIPDFLYSRTSDSYLVKEMTLDIHNHDRKLLNYNLRIEQTNILEPPSFPQHSCLQTWWMDSNLCFWEYHKQFIHIQSLYFLFLPEQF